MAPLSTYLVVLTTASAALAHRGHHAFHKHRNKRSQAYGALDANSTATDQDVTVTSTQTLTSTIYSTVYEDLSTGVLTATPAGAFAGASTCGGTIIVTVTATATVTSTSSPAPPYPTAASSSAAAIPGTSVSSPLSSSSTPTPTPTPATPAIAAAPTSSASSYVVPAAAPTTTPAAAAPAPAPAPSVDSAPAPAPSVDSAPAPAPSVDSAPAPAPAPATSAAAPAPATSSAAASPPASGSYGGSLGTKRGCLYNTASDCSVLKDSTISWATNWASSADGNPGGNVFIPQLWGKMSTDGSVDFTASWTANANAAIANGATAVLGFNEPENSGQSNLTPGAAAALWPLVSAFSGKATIVSPAVMSTQQGTSFPGLDWLSSFSGAGASWDATAVHFYGTCSYDASDSASFSGQVQYLKNMVQEASSRFGKPVWVTELGCADTNSSPDQVAAFFKAALPYLEGESCVHQYAAFKADLLVSGSSPNAAGSTYMSIPAAS